MTKKTTHNDEAQVIQTRKNVLAASSSSYQQARPRIVDRRDPARYSDDITLTQYEYPEGEEVSCLQRTIVDSVIRWVLDRYDVGGAEAQYLELLEKCDFCLTKLHGDINLIDPIPPAERTRSNSKSHMRFRAHRVVGLRDEINDSLDRGDVDDAVTQAIHVILDGELYLKHCCLPRPVCSPPSVATTPLLKS